eukprot:g15126.t1
MQRIFDACEAEPQLKTAFEMRSERHIKAKELCSGLLKFGGLYCAEQLRELLNKMEESLEGEKIVPVQFYEFLVCCRRLQDGPKWCRASPVWLRSLSHGACEDGIIEGEELREFCKPLGFTLSNDEWEELLEEQEVSPDDDIDFEGAWNFLKGVQRKNGFTQTEQEELDEAFHRFSDDTGVGYKDWILLSSCGPPLPEGELQNLKVQDLLTYIGFQTSVEDVQSMVRRVDFNSNKTMDKDEFLRLMRLQRETTLGSYTAAYTKNRLYARNAAPPAEIQRVLEVAGHRPNVDGRQEQPSLSFEGFLKVADFCRKTIPQENRKFAHFTLQEIEDLRRKGAISMGSFLWLLSDTDLQVNTVNGRARTYEQLERAREAALEAGVPKAEVGGLSSPRVRFMPVVHFVYETVKNHHDSVFQREDAALLAVEFSAEEVGQFRELFNTLVQQRDEELEAAAKRAREQPKIGRRLSAVQAAQVLAEAEEAQRLQKERELTLGSVIRRLTHVARVPGSEIVKMMAMMGVKMSATLRQELMDRTAEFSDCPEEGLDFPGFLQLMQWMVGSNFGNINGAAERTVKSQGLMDKNGRLQAGLVFGKFGHMDSVTVRSRRTVQQDTVDLAAIGLET